MVNDEAAVAQYGDAAAALVGEANLDRNSPSGMGSEDFSFMMGTGAWRTHQSWQR